jgi:hypothetical protein
LPEEVQFVRDGLDDSVARMPYSLLSEELHLRSRGAEVWNTAMPV